TAQHMVPSPRPIQQSDCGASEVIKSRMRKKDGGIQEQQVRAIVRQPEPRSGEERQAIVDARGNRDLADGVEPGGEEAPSGTAEDGRPMVERSGRRVRRG